MSEITSDLLEHSYVIGPTILPAESSATSVVAFARGGEPEPDTGTEDEPEGEPEGETPEGGKEAGDESGEPAEPAEPSEEERPRSRFQARFTDLTHERDAAKAHAREVDERARLVQQELDYWKQRALTPSTAAETPPAMDIPRYPNGRPQPPMREHFSSPDQFEAARLMYEDALLTWGVQHAMTQQTQQQQDLVRLQGVREQYPDYDRVAGQSRMQLNQDVSQAILAHPQRFELVYYLAQHPELEVALAPKQGVEAGMLVAMLAHDLPKREADASPTREEPAAAGRGPEPTRTTSTAPPPIAPTRGTGARAPRGYDELSLHEFIARRNQEEQAFRR